MRKYLLLLCVLQILSFQKIFSQNIPNGATGPSGKTPIQAPATIASPSLFYQRVFTPNIPITDSSLVNLSATVDDVGVTTQYMDGLGRPLETIVKQGSPLKKDLISPSAYDAFGNQSINYLPYAATSGTDGKFKSNPFRNDSTFYMGQFPNEDIYYGETLFDGSPLNKTLKQMAPGNSWAGSSRGVSYDERANAVSDSIRIWSIAISSEDDVPTNTSTYPAGSLLVEDVTDERGNETISYVNELGRTVLTKTQINSSPSTGHTGWLCTYYVYDEMSHLRFVIPPKATSFLLTNSWDLVDNSDVVSNLCYSYWYDSRGRVTEKHIPGKGKTYIAYDLFDHVVLMQDENLRTTSQWAFAKYDGQSRSDTSGVITLSGLTAAQVITNAATSSDYPKLTGTYTVLAVRYYDDYSWNTGGSTMPGPNLNTANINGTNFITTYNSSPYYAQQITQSQRTRGLSTGSQRLVLGTSTYLYTVNIYDDRSRVIQVKQSNYTGGTDISTTQYDFSGKILRNHLAHQKEGANTINHTLLTKFSYDHVGRLTSIIKNMDGSGDKTTVQNTYNELSQLSSKTYGNSLETQTLTYNIRGWLSSINKTYVEATSGTGTGYFGEELFYDYGFTTLFYNGNISGVKWKSGGDDIQRAYGYGYDIANRLTKADFTQQNQGSSSWTSDKMDFSVSGLKYDANGNITNMNQRGVNVNTPLLIDSLTYTHFTNSNQLEKVKDLSGNTVNLGDFTDTTLTGDDYTYDENGNQTKDNNKHIHTGGGGSGTTYNFLDKPDSIHVNGKGSIIYVYDATGTVLQKTITDTKLNTKTVITYVAGFVYQKILASSGNASTVPDTLQYALHEEGRIRPLSPGVFVYDYFLKDHLGNIRSVITDEQDTDAYPVASLESATINNEKIYYSGLDSGVIDRSSVTNYPTTDTYTSPNNKIQQLRGDGLKIGAGILLKVMAGDTINVHAASWWKAMGLTPDAPVSPLNDIVSAITSSLPGVSGNKYIASQLGSTVLNPSISSFLSTRDATYNNAHPSSWLNIVVLDEQLNPVITNDGNNSYYEQVGNASTTNVKQYNQSRVITKSGYVYVYVSNECPNIYTYWDDLQVTHLKGHLLQENGYYPFGLEMKALSSQAALKPQTSYKFNAGTNLESDFDVDYYETYFRNYDPQIGTFTGIDALSERLMAMTTYQFSGDNPINFNDPWGLVKNEPKYKGFWDAMIGQINYMPSSTSAMFNYHVGDDGEVQETYIDFNDPANDFSGGDNGGGGGVGGGFVTAYSYLNGGPPTTAEVQTFMESYGATRGWYDVHVSEASAYQGKGDGFNVGYSFDPEGAATATHDVGVGSMFISTNGLEKLMDWDVGIENQSSGNNYAGTEHENENIAQGTEFFSLNATAVASSEALTKLDETVKIAETTEKVISVATKGFAILDVGNTYLKWQNGQISTTHAIIDGIADGFTFVGLPEVTAIWGIADFIIGDW